MIRLDRPARPIHPQDVFAAHLEQAYRGCLESGLPLSVVLIDLRHAPGREPAQQALVRLLETDLRKTDEAGWVTSDRAAILLRATGAHGGRVFCARLRARLADDTATAWRLFTRAASQAVPATETPAIMMTLDATIATMATDTFAGLPDVTMVAHPPQNAPAMPLP